MRRLPGVIPSPPQGGTPRSILVSIAVLASLLIPWLTGAPAFAQTTPPAASSSPAGSRVDASALILELDGLLADERHEQAQSVYQQLLHSRPAAAAAGLELLSRRATSSELTVRSVCDLASDGVPAEMSRSVLQDVLASSSSGEWTKTHCIDRLSARADESFRDPFLRLAKDHSRNPNLRISALRAAKSTWPLETHPTLVDLLQSAQEPIMHHKALQYLAGSEHPDTEALIERFVLDSDPSTSGSSLSKEYGLIILRRRLKEDVLPLLASILRDESWPAEIQERAIDLLARSGLPGGPEVLAQARVRASGNGVPAPASTRAPQAEPCPDPLLQPYYNPGEVGDLLFISSPGGEMYGDTSTGSGIDFWNSGHVGVFIGHADGGSVPHVVEALGWGTPGWNGVRYTEFNGCGDWHFQRSCDVGDYVPKGARTPTGGDTALRRRNVVLLALDQVGEGYDEDFSDQKGPGSFKNHQWICTGLSEKAWESADLNGWVYPEDGLPLMYSQQGYAVNNVPDGSCTPPAPWGLVCSDVERTFTVLGTVFFPQTLRQNLAVAAETEPTAAPTFEPRAPNPNGWYHSDVTLAAVSAADNPDGSGIYSTCYSLDGGAWSKFLAPVAISGSSSVSVKAMDNAGTYSTPVTVEIRIDNLPPSLAVTGPCSSACAVPGPSIRLEGSITDTGGSGVDHVVVHNAATLQSIIVPVHAGPFAVPVEIEAGDNLLTVRGYDAAGNTSTVATITVTECADADLDSVCSTLDCNESNPHCSTDCTDADGDEACGTHDCDDSNRDVYPGAPEICDGIKNDCDRRTFGGRLISANAVSARQVHAADLDGDNDLDVLSASRDDNKIAWYENMAADGSAWTEHAISLLAYDARTAYPADVDGDGDLDVVVAAAASATGNVSWYENRLDEATRDFGPPSVIGNNYSAQQVVATDLDADGDVDVAVAVYFESDKVAWYENRAPGDGSFWTVHEISRAPDPGAWSIFAADVDGDDDVDLVAGDDSGAVWYENDGSGSGSASESSDPAFIRHTVRSGSASSSVSAADLDGDYDVDVAAAFYGVDRIAWYENATGDGSAWTTHVLSDSADYAMAVTAADLDRDGRPDLVTAAAGDDEVAWYRNLGETNFAAEQVISRSADGPLSVFAADLDGDTYIDVLSASADDNEVAWYRNGDFGEIDRDADGVCDAEDCDDGNPGCTTDCTDLDGDGRAHCQGDCDDSRPGCTTDCTDADGDGYCPPIDCDDAGTPDPADGVMLQVFKGPGAGELTLDWTGGQPTFDVFRSTSALDVTDPANWMAATAERAWSDTPPPARIHFYMIATPCVVSCPEICDGIDNDCDGSVDEAGAEVSCGPPLSIAVCVAGTCRQNQCAPNWWDLNGDPADGCEYYCLRQSMTDEPDPAFVDADCDGIDGDIDDAVFVSSSGSDTNDGTVPGLPVATIARGIAIASSAARPQVLVERGSYTGGALVLRKGIGVYGNYEPGFHQRNAMADLTEYTASVTTAVEAFGITSPTVLEHLRLVSADATLSGESSYGIRATWSPGLVVRHCRVVAGAGAAGTNGSSGPNGVNGGAGAAGGPGACNNEAAPGAGGPGGRSDCLSTGGPGGWGGENGSGFNGRVGQTGGFPYLPWPIPGSGAGGAGGAGGTLSGCTPNGNSNGRPGVGGPDGADGSNGPGGSGGALTDGLWVGSAGGSGAGGSHGGGGGGGGGGAGQHETGFPQICTDGAGNGGGGGGGGGCGGGAGEGGRAGGGSFGVFLVESEVSIVSSIIESRIGGDGGAGAAGGSGGTGGLGAGGNGYCDSEIGWGGTGGRGGNGGDGGAGGGGAGGPSYSIFSFGTNPRVESTTLIHGLGGAGGASPGNPGSPGGSGEVWLGEVVQTVAHH